jgi:hypothetical protein
MTTPPVTPPLNLEGIDIKVGGDIPPETPVAFIGKDEFDALTPEEKGSQRWGYKSPFDKERKARRERKPPKPVPPKPRPGALTKPLAEFYASLGMMILPFDEPCGTAVIANAENCARSLENLARENESARRLIMALVQTSAIGGVVAAHLPLMMAVAAHHVPAFRNNPDVVAPLHSMSRNGTVSSE